MFWLQLNMFQVLTLYLFSLTMNFTFGLSDGEVPGGAGCGDLPVRQLPALHHRQKREEDGVNSVLVENIEQLGSAGFWTNLTSL